MKFICGLLLLVISATHVSAGTLAEMRHLGQVSFCLNLDAMPYSQRDVSDKISGNGFLFEISTELIRRMGMTSRVVWLNSLERLNKTDCDLVPSTLVEEKELISQNEKIKKDADKTYGRLFTKPYSHVTGFLVSKSKEFNDFESL